jgi:hypothetical protein
MGIHLVPVEHPDNSDEPQVDPAGLSGLIYMGNSRMVTDLVLVNGRYVAIEYMDDGDAPILDSED